MRYHWGLGVGHFHVHEPTSTFLNITDKSAMMDLETSGDVITTEPEALPTHAVNDPDHKTADPEMGLEDHDPEGWEDVESDDSERDSICGIDSDNSDFGETYG
jgi:hypothetical protein